MIGLSHYNLDRQVLPDASVTVVRPEYKADRSAERTDFALLASALLFVRNLLVLHLSPQAAIARPLYALAVHPPQRVPAALNGFALWNVLVLIVMALAYGYPIAQFAIAPSPSAIVHRIE